MRSMHGIDIGQKLSLSQLDLIASRGFGWLAGYLDGSQGASAKSLNSDMVSIALSRRLGILPVFEIGGSVFTYDNGRLEGGLARKDALALGYPLGFPIPTAIDKDVNPDQDLLNYLNGYVEGLQGTFLPGVYGSDKVVKFARENWYAIGFFWQTYAWSAGLVYPAADAFQHANGVPIGQGLTVDLNIARTDIPWRLA